MTKEEIPQHNHKCIKQLSDMLDASGCVITNISANRLYDTLHTWDSIHNIPYGAEFVIRCEAPTVSVLQQLYDFKFPDDYCEQDEYEDCEDYDDM